MASEPQSNSHELSLQSNQLATQRGGIFSVSAGILDETSTKFSDLVHRLSSELNFKDVIGALQTLLGKSIAAMPIHVPTRVESVSSLCKHLIKLRMCHETDVDLLHQLLETMQQEKLKEEVTTYARRNAQMDVVQHLCNKQADPSEYCFLIITYHNILMLTFDKAFDIKCYISELLDIQRHMFTLVGAESGSIGLIWQMPNEYLQPMKMLFKEERVKSSLISSEYHIASIKLKADKKSAASVVFTRSPRQCSDEDTSASTQVLLPSATAAILPSKGSEVESTSTYIQESSSTLFESAVQEEGPAAFITNESMSSYVHSKSDEVFSMSPVQEETVAVSDTRKPSESIRMHMT